MVIMMLVWCYDVNNSNGDNDDGNNNPDMERTLVVICHYDAKVAPTTITVVVVIMVKVMTLIQKWQ